jgi:hypothetical protein
MYDVNEHRVEHTRCQLDLAEVAIALSHRILTGAAPESTVGRTEPQVENRVVARQAALIEHRLVHIAHRKPPNLVGREDGELKFGD